MLKFTKTTLRQFKHESESVLLKSVITDVLSQGNAEEIKEYLKDVYNHGCSSGVATSMIYYKDTRKFFEKHYEEILSLVEGLHGVPMDYNSLAWRGYEWAIMQIIEKFELW